VFDYIERFYNLKRTHSKIGYMSPMEVREASWISLTEYHPNRMQDTRNGVIAHRGDR
jgi:hypothetical protein